VTLCVEQVYSDHYNHVLRYLISRINCCEDAEDVAQETFIKVARNLDRYKEQPGVPMVAWILSIAHNLTVSYYRKQAVRAKHDGGELNFDPVDNEEPPEIPAAITHEIGNAIRALQPDYQAILMRWATNTRPGKQPVMTNAERTRLHRAQKRLREMVLG